MASDCSCLLGPVSCWDDAMSPWMSLSFFRFLDVLVPLRRNRCTTSMQATMPKRGPIGTAMLMVCCMWQRLLYKEQPPITGRCSCWTFTEHETIHLLQQNSQLPVTNLSSDLNRPPCASGWLPYARWMKAPGHRLDIISTTVESMWAWSLWHMHVSAPVTGGHDYRDRLRSYVLCSTIGGTGTGSTWYDDRRYRARCTRRLCPLS